MNEIIFIVEEAFEGGYQARALGASIFTEADDLETLHTQVRDAVSCHFDEGKAPRIIRLHCPFPTGMGMNRVGKLFAIIISLSNK